jgi:hypothetical protein
VPTGEGLFCNVHPRPASSGILWQEPAGTRGTWKGAVPSGLSKHPPCGRDSSRSDRNRSRTALAVRIERGPDLLASLGQVVTNHMRGTHKGCPYVVGMRQEDAMRHEAAMNDAQLVRGVQTARCLLQYFRAFSHGQRPARLERLAQGLGFQIFHRDVRLAIIALTRFVNGYNVGMVDAAGGSCFVLEAPQEVRIVEPLAEQNLQRHETIADGDLLGEIACPHAARAQLADDPAILLKTNTLSIQFCDIDEKGPHRKVLESSRS